MVWPDALAPLGERLTAAFGAKVSAAWSAALTAPRLPSFRVNEFKNPVEAVVAACASAGIRADPQPLAPWAFTTDAAGERDLKRHPLFHNGGIYVQSLPSQAGALALDPQPGQRWLDACAAPGGKTSLIATLSGKGTPGTAIEWSRVRFDQLRHTIHRQGCTWVQAVNQDSRSPSAAIRALRYGRILVDAPCSGTGTLHLDDPRSYAHLADRYAGYADIKAGQQRGIVTAMLTLLAPGGKLLYSTCAIDPVENELVVDALLKADPSLDLDPLAPPAGLPAVPALTSLGGLELDPRLARCVRLAPSALGEGFFLARLLKRS